MQGGLVILTRIIPKGLPDVKHLRKMRIPVQDERSSGMKVNRNPGKVESDTDVTPQDKIAGKRYLEFFTVTIRNRNTRRAYFVAVAQFSAWCDGRGLSLLDVEPIHVAAYIEQFGTVVSKPTVKQHLAAIRMLFDWLVTGQVIALDPAHGARAAHSVKKGKTFVLSADKMRQLLASIETDTLIGLRDCDDGLHLCARRRGRRHEDRGFYFQKRRGWVRLHEKSGKVTELPAITF